MSIKAPEIYRISTDETRNVSVDFTNVLDSGETISGTPTVECSANLTISGEQANTTTVTIKGVTVAIGLAAQFTVSSATPGKYLIDVKCATTESQTVEGIVTLIVVSTLH